MEKFLDYGLGVYFLCILLSKGYLTTIPCRLRTEETWLVVPHEIPYLDEEGH